MSDSTASKGKALLIVTISYILCFAAAHLSYPFVHHYHPIITAVILDVIATVVIFLFSMAYRNSSFYDPYWSVIPIPIVFYWALLPEASDANFIRQVLVIGLVLFWAIRLTFNWVRRWHGLKDEDWRYVDLKNQSGKAYWLVSLTGIHLFPTILVFLGLLPTYPALVQNSAPIGLIDIIATVVTFGAVMIELISDEQLRKFLVYHKKGPEDFLATGLWKYSRHPNYHGEVLFWVGLFLFSLSGTPFQWWYASGAIAMLLLFNFISVPMIDKRMKARKPAYAEYMRKTSPLFIWFARK